MATMQIDTQAFERLQEAMTSYAGDAESAINEVLWEQGYEMISTEIMKLLPRSGRTWRGKRKAAADAQPFTMGKDNLSVTVKTKSAYNYLYFPDDGSTTKRHYGGQEFMYRGAEREQDNIIELCINRLVEKFSKGD